jgi:hypothetical protein
VLEVVRGRKPAYQRERELINTYNPSLNTFWYMLYIGNTVKIVVADSVGTCTIGTVEWLIDCFFGVRYD